MNDIFKRLPRLCQVHINVLSQQHITIYNILEWINVAENLQSLTLIRLNSTSRHNQKLDFSVDTFRNLLEIVEKRCRKTHLDIKLSVCSFVINVPSDLARAHKELVSISSYSGSGAVIRN